MERLTEWIDEERAIPRMDLRRNGHERCTTQLARYEDTGLTPEQVRDLKEAEEQGLLLRLPCKIGKTVYYIQKCLAPSCKECRGFTRVDNCYCEYKARIFEQQFSYRHIGGLGYSVFLNREAAEKALAEMEDNQ